ncbi:class I SAM-dependent methyltransferase [Nocardioides caldifontis]|uniref:class I SAM-dependent methyltransferase n=1 Tax=Nocardioides caldifontis TaxID=2588938 RepID=UPI0011DF4943|nr:class I SAM-dependent methyltransferase [Nocardioides caldifontis]
MDADAWDARYAASDQVWSRGPNQFVEAELADLPPGAALDVACGEGRNALWLAQRGWDVTALDFSAVAVERGRRLAGDLPVAWVVGDALTVELPEVDLVVLAYLQLAEDERRTAVRRSFAALRPGGTFFLVAHDSTNLTEGTGGPQDPAVLYTADDVLADLAGEPFDVVRAGRVARVVPADDDHGGEADRTAWDALVRLVRR